MGKSLRHTEAHFVIYKGLLHWVTAYSMTTHGPHQCHPSLRLFLLARDLRSNYFTSKAPLKVLSREHEELEEMPQHHHSNERTCDSQADLMIDVIIGLRRSILGPLLHEGKMSRSASNRTVSVISESEHTAKKKKSFTFNYF